MKRVLVVYYSQSGQLGSIADRIAEPLRADPNIEVRVLEVRPKAAYPFPWTFFRFLDAFPESVYLDPPALAPLDVAVTDGPFDLVILAYQVWFLSPSLPMTAFVQSEEGRRLLAGKPVITLIGCRNMWVTAQEKMKQLLRDAGARLIDNVVLTDRGGFSTFFTTPYWLLTGKRQTPWGPAGINAEDIAASARFGHALVRALRNNEERTGKPLLGGLRAVEVDVRLLASERVAHRSFLVWGRLLRAVGKAGAWQRKPVLLIYVTFLITLILTVVPLSMALKALLRPLVARKLALAKEQLEQPSGSSAQRMEMFHG